MKEKIRENGDKIKQNKVLPYLVSNVVEVSHVYVVNVSVKYEFTLHNRFLIWIRRQRTGLLRTATLRVKASAL